MRAVLAGRDALGILPTGGGKSVCYQVPALALGGLTLVVTPLVSLMEDQVVRARAAGLRAAWLSANQSPDERRATLAAAKESNLDMLFVAPERLELDAFRGEVFALDVRLLAIDEAHCISEWGHDFRPSYRRIGALRRGLRCPTLALTATATPAVRDDVMQSLALASPLVVVRSFDRPNLSWAVLPGRSLGERVAATYGVLAHVRGTAIVYAPTRRTVERVRDGLANRGLATEAYHAGLPGSERSRVQQAFMSGACRVVVATNAFGMGIDKADVRVVIHVQLPGTLEAYYQEAGRAGRDGQPSRCIAFHTRTDKKLARSFVDRTHPPPRALRRLRERLRCLGGLEGVVHVDSARADGLDAEMSEWLEDTGVGAVAALERIGAVRRLPPARGDEGGHPRLGVHLRLDLAEARSRRAHALAKVEAVEDYARVRGCRRRALLRYFGEETAARCGACDRCGASVVGKAA